MYLCVGVRCFGIGRTEVGADGFLCSSGSCACACVYVGEQCYGIWLTLADYGCFVLAE